MSQRLITYQFDGGGARRIGGPVGWGWACCGPDGRELFNGCGSLPGPSTNNVAEYTALIMAATHASAHSWGLNDVFVFEGDSKLVVEQVNGLYRVKAPHLIELRARAWDLVTMLGADMRWIPRAENARADMLATQGRDNHDGRSRSKTFTRR